jgi:hypothetical protein
LDVGASAHEAAHLLCGLCKEWNTELEGRRYTAVCAVEAQSELEGQRYTAVCAIESPYLPENPRYAAVCAVESAANGLRRRLLGYSVVQTAV